ncbi:MAG: type II toxin-antitoxin system VapC family toxin [Caulobacteraceae bacterium]
MPALSRWMLDTNTVSHILKGRPAVVRERLAATPMAEVCVSAITEGELRFGVAKRPDAANLGRAVAEFLLRVDILAWDSAAAERYGALRARLERVGKPLGNLDTLIAAHALTAGARLVTSDGAFKRVEGLTVVNWTAA